MKPFTNRAAPGSPGANPRLRLLLLLGGILALATALDFIHLGAQSLDLDESTSVAFAHLAWRVLGKVLWHGEANMALYYGILHPWVGLLGDSEFSVRMLSTLTAVGAVGAIYVLGTRLFDTRVGLISALLLAVNADRVAYGQYARSYSLLLVLVILASLAFLQVIERPYRRNLAVYTMTSVLAVYAHLFALLVLAAQWFSLAFLERQRAVLKTVVTSAAIMCLLLVPLGFVALTNAYHLSWLSKPNRHTILGLFYALVGASPTGAKPLLAAYVVACSAALIAWIKEFHVSPFSFQTWRYSFLLTWFFAPIVLTLGVSIIKPIFFPTYLIICLPPLVLLAAIGISRIRIRSGIATVLLVVVALAAYEDVAYYRTPGRDDWRAALGYVASRSRPGDGLIFYPAYMQQPYDYYRTRLFLTSEPPVAFPRHWSWAPKANGEPMEQPADALLKNLPFHYSRIWLVSDVPPPLNPRVSALLREDYARRVEVNFQAVRVALYSVER